MPSGAKKRKAAKKKKELQANTNNNNNSTHPQEHDDAKSQDEKGSDGGEVSSPAYQDHHNNNDHHPFNEGNEVRNPSDVRSIVSEEEGNKSMEKVPSGVVEGVEGKVRSQDGNDAAKAERSSKSAELSKSRSINIEGFDFSKVSNDGDGKSSSSSSSSSSDDEAQSTKKKPNESEAAPTTKNKSSWDDNLVAEVSSVAALVKPTLNVVESALVDNSLVSEATKLKTDAEELSNVVKETVTGFSPKEYKDKVLSDASKLEKNYEEKVVSEATKLEKQYEDKAISEGTKLEKQYEDKVLSEATKLEKKYEDKVSEVTKLEKKYEDKVLSGATKLETGAEKLSNVIKDTVAGFSPKKYEDKVFSLLDEYSKGSPSELGSDSKGDDDKELPPSQHAHVAETTPGTESSKDPEKEPLIARDRRPAQRTSWLNCCGILDLLSGSSR